MTQQIKRRAKADAKLTEYEQKMLQLASENNALLRENNEILKKVYASIARIEEYTRSIKANTSSL